MKYLGIDLGSKTIGLATGQGLIANSWKTIRFKEFNYKEGISNLLKCINEYKPNKIILGYPINMDGSIGESAQTVLKFKERLKENLTENIDIVLIDERKSTFSAKQILISANLTRKKQKEKKDQLAASIILQNYFDSINQN